VAQTYGYDKLNRLTSAAENTSAWAQSYGYDVRGNRWVTSTSSNLPQPTLETPNNASWYTSSNRISGWSYDAAGNVLQVGNMTRSFTYDAESRQVSATINTNTSNYTFDGLGQRVTKVVGTVTTVYVYDAFGNLAAEYSSQAGTSPCGTSTCYVSWDHLGSMRMLTDANGSSTVKRYDYLPFGGELLAGINGRTTGMGYYSNPDSTNPKFTGQMRDSETYDPNGGTANDWFIARTFSGGQGRFQSVDPGNAGADPSNPQTWNAYAYVGNNPLSYTDPSGMYQSSGGGGGGYGAVAGLIVAGFEAFGDWIESLFSSSSPPPPNWANVQQIPVTSDNPCSGSGFGYCSQGPYPGVNSGNNIGFIPVFYAQGTSNLPAARSTNLTPANPCAEAGGAPDPAYYAQLGKAASSSLLGDARNLFQFRRGGALDAQVGLGPNRKPFGGSPAYANYTFGVYNAAAKRTLDGTLKLADTYAELRSHYPPATPMAGPAYPYTPQVNVTNITYGFKAQISGTTCHK
jgi:RHS repeat-associated protein